MGYDENGNWDYSEAAIEEAFRPRRGQRLAAALGNGGRVLGVLAVIVVLAGVIIGLSYGGWYFAGRAIGAGVKDAR